MFCGNPRVLGTSWDPALRWWGLGLGQWSTVELARDEIHVWQLGRKEGYAATGRMMGTPPLRIRGLFQGVYQVVFNYINVILRGRFLTVVINHVSKSWDDPPSGATRLWRQIVQNYLFVFQYDGRVFFPGTESLHVCTGNPPLLYFFNNPFMFPDSWRFLLAWLAWIPWNSDFLVQMYFLSMVQKSGEKTTRDGDKTPCFPSGRNYQQNNWLLPTSTGFAEISEPSKVFPLKQLPFSGDEFVDFHLRSLCSTGLQKPTLGLPSVCWIWLLILFVYAFPLFICWCI